jgi:uncharacterized membrane protein
MASKSSPILNFHPQVSHPETIWVIPIFYLGLALVMGLVLPRIDLLLTNQQSYFSPNTAISLLSAISSGMIAFTGFVFSMLFLMVQFGSSAYTPRIIRYLVQDPIVPHSLGVFIATFSYSLLILSRVDISGSGLVSDYSVASAMIFMLASIIMFLMLIRRIASLQVNQILDMIGAGGVLIIEGLYPLLPTTITNPSFQDSTLIVNGDHRKPIDPAPISIESLPPVLEEIFYDGRPQRVLEFDLQKMVHIAQVCEVVIQVEHGVGDMVANHRKMITVRGRGPKGPGRATLKSVISLGPQRTIEQDSRYAIRLIVDIGIRALSPAINDPTTAVLALDQLDDLLQRIGIRDLNIGYVYDENGDLRVFYPTPDWNDFLTLALDEIHMYGANSQQVMRRLRALLLDLRQEVPPERLAAIDHQLARVDATITRSFPDPIDQALARESDQQGISIVK